MVRRETVLDWRRELRFTHCGIGFGGPVNFAGQRVVLSTHVGGWRDFDLPGFVAGLAGAVGEAGFGAGKGCSPLFLRDALHRHRSGIYQDGRVWRGADSCGGEIGRLTIRPGGPDCLCGARGCFERMCCDLWLDRDHGRSARELLEDPAFAERYVVDLALGLKAAIMLLESRPHRDWRRHRQGRRPPLRSLARRVAPPDHRMVRRARRRQRPLRRHGSGPRLNSSLLPQRLRRIDARRSQRRQPACPQPGHYQERRRRDERHNVPRAGG